jgi:hypothetical protein
MLAAKPELREQAEAYAVGRMSDEDQDAVAADVEFALCGLDIEELNGRAGYRPGVGYVHPTEAAGEILERALKPFLTTSNAEQGWASIRRQRRPP